MTEYNKVQFHASINRLVSSLMIVCCLAVEAESCELAFVSSSVSMVHERRQCRVCWGQFNISFADLTVDVLGILG